MTAPPNSAPTVQCPRCQAPNPAEARFCAGCGGTLAGGAAPNAGTYAPPPPPPPHNNYPPPPPPPPPSGFSRGIGGVGSGGQASLNADQATAFAQAVAAVGSANGQVLWQAPPQSLKYSVIKKDFWLTGGQKINFIGDVSVMAAGPRQSTVRIDCKPESISRLMSMSIGITLVGTFLNLSTGFAFFFLLIGGASAAWQAYSLTSSVPKELADGILAQIQMNAYAGGGAPASAPPPPPPPPNGQYAPPPPPPPPAAETSGLVEQMKQLTQMRDMGALTPEEFEAKKAELLKRL